jgi:hypothetical protein
LLTAVGQFRLRLDRQIHRAGETSKRCPKGQAGCSGGKTLLPVKNTLEGVPQVVTLGLVWESERAKPQMIESVLRSIDPYINLNRLFDNVAHRKQSINKDEVVAARLQVHTRCALCARLHGG